MGPASVWQLAAVVLMACSATAYAAPDRPAWVERTPASDGRYRYYGGIASLAASEEQALRTATENAYRQAVRENFGAVIRISEDSTQTNSDSTSVLRITENTRAVHVDEFEQADRYVEQVYENNSPIYNAWVLYRFAKSAIAREKRRLAIIFEDALDDSQTRCAQ